MPNEMMMTMMKVGVGTVSSLLLIILSNSAVIAFTLYPVDHHQRLYYQSLVLRSAVAEESTSLPTTAAVVDSSESEATEVNENIPTNLPSECGMDYVPLATMLATGQIAEADQVN